MWGGLPLRSAWHCEWSAPPTAIVLAPASPEPHQVAGIGMTEEFPDFGGQPHQRVPTARASGVVLGLPSTTGILMIPSRVPGRPLTRGLAKEKHGWRALRRAHGSE